MNVKRDIKRRGCLGFAPCSQSLVFAALPQYTQSARNLDSLRSVRPQIRRTRFGVFSPISPLIKKTHLMMSLFYGAGDEARTRDIFLGKEAFYH